MVNILLDKGYVTKTKKKQKKKEVNGDMKALQNFFLDKGADNKSGVFKELLYIKPVKRDIKAIYNVYQIIKQTLVPMIKEQNSKLIKPVKLA